MAEGMVGQAESPAIGRSRVASLALCGVMAALVAVCAWVSLPLYPVPFTLQTLGVLVAGGLLGRKLGPITLAVYILAGLVGAPIFAGGHSGPGVLLGPTGGYLVGFVGAAFIMGWAGDIARRGARGQRLRGATRAGKASAVLHLAVGALLASVVIYLIGVPWLALVTGMGLKAALTAGMVPYLLSDTIKAALAVVLVRAVDRALVSQGLR